MSIMQVRLDYRDSRSLFRLVEDFADNPIAWLVIFAIAAVLFIAFISRRK